MALKYIGDGETIYGPGGVAVPPRDLTDEEQAEHAAVLAIAPRASALYEPMKQAKPAGPAKDGN